MSKPPYRPNVEGFTFRYAGLIYFWNHAEQCARQIAQLLLGESTMSMAVTAELGNRSLVEAIEVASREMGALGEHLQHFTNGYSTLVGYRNFYVHSLTGLQHDGLVPGDTEGVLFSIDGKGRVKYFNRTLKSADLDKAVGGIHQLIGYGAAIQKELGATGESIDRLIEAYQASLEKPHWPKPVTKTPLYLQGQEPPPPEPKRKRGTRQGGR